MDAWIEFLRVAGAAAILFAIGPYLSAPGNPVHIFIRAVLFFEVVGLILGSWRLAHPGILAFIAIGWLSALAIFSRPHDWLYDGFVSKEGFLRILIWIEERQWRGQVTQWSSRLHAIRIRPGVLLLAMLTFTALLAWLRFPLSNFRFFEGESYWRAISLQAMLLGQSWMPDGSVAFLAVVGHLAGVDGSGVIRWIVPLVATGMVAAVGYCAWCWTGRIAPAWLASVLYLLYRGWIASDPLANSAKGELAALFWVIAAGVFRRSVIHAIASAAIAIMIYQGFPRAAVPAFLVYPLAIPLGLFVEWIATRLPEKLQFCGAMVATVLCCAMVFARPHAPAAEGPLQYESAARVASRIAKHRPRNTYMIVAPTPDLAMFQGHGWHLELSEFVTRSRDWPVESPAFRFPFEPTETFIFVEKEPLAEPAISPAMAVDTSSYHYYTRMGRTSLQFQAARTMALYARTHPATSVYYEDDRLIVYRAESGPLSQSP